MFKREAVNCYCDRFLDDNDVSTYFRSTPKWPEQRESLSEHYRKVDELSDRSNVVIRYLKVPPFT